MNQNKHQKSSIAAIILAAGASTRMGQPKQLLPYKRRTLLSHVINCVIASSCRIVIVILGANSDKIEPQIAQFPIIIVKNSDWNKGISSSIGCGVNYIQEKKLNINGVIFLTCDQPFISTKIIDQLIEANNLTNQSIIATHYEKTLGIPVLFSSSFFSELIELRGDNGAKKIINKYPELVKKIDFTQGKIDLDTVKDYQQLISKDDANP